MKFLLFLLLGGCLLLLCWPFALLLLFALPLLWLLSIPFRVLGAVVDGLIALLRALFLLPARILGGGRSRY